jgi:nucleotide-binding universal stress UspA family protein
MGVEHPAVFLCDGLGPDTDAPTHSEAAMKILIAYDGTECSDAAIVNLRRAGLPADAHALVLSVAEGSPRPASVPYLAAVSGAGMIFPDNTPSEESTARHLQQAQAFAAQGAQRLRADFPDWKIETEAWVDSPGAAIIRKTHAWNPNLIVVGSHCRHGISRMMLGSVSLRVLNHVDSSVRISRHRLHAQDRPVRLVIGVDGSNCAKTAVRAVAHRPWPKGAQVQVIGVRDTRIEIADAGAPEAYIPPITEDAARRALSDAVHEATEELAKSHLHATYQVLTGIPCETLLAEAERWEADSIFVGARGLNRLERLFLGSVSTAVASNARCSVEVVRCSGENVMR